MSNIKTIGSFAALVVTIFWAASKVMGETARLTVEQVRTLARNAVNRDGLPVDPIMLQAMTEIESSRNPMAMRAEPQIGDASIGLMQTLMKTSKWLYDDMGARKFGEPTAERLFNPEVSMYFAGQYIKWLANYRGERRSEDWIVMSYNGGPGADNDQTRNHLRKYHEAKNRLLRGS